MAGIDPELNRKLMATLRRCDAFSSNSELRSVFVDARLSPWAYNVPEAGSTYSRVQATIAFLHDKANTQGQNALVLLLQVLQDRYDPEDAYRGELSSLVASLDGAPMSPIPTSSPSTSPRSTSGKVDYDAGIRNLLARLGPGHARYDEALVYQQRLDENLRNSRLFGDTETRRAERAEIIMQLNSLALATLNVAFNELAGMSQATAGQPTVSPPTAGNITIVGDGNVIGSNNQVAVNTAGSTSSSTAPSNNRSAIESTLKQARRVLEHLELQAAGYGSLAVPAHIQIQLEDQREKVAQLEAQLAGSGGGSVQPASQSDASVLPDRTFVVKLLTILSQRFALDELETLCFALGVEYEDLPADSRSGKARELIEYCERHNCIPQLVEVGKTLRMDVGWP